LDAFKKWLGQSKLGERHESGEHSGRGRGLSMQGAGGVDRAFLDVKKPLFVLL
jgi:hypothetical protein